MIIASGTKQLFSQYKKNSRNRVEFVHRHQYTDATAEGIQKEHLKELFSVMKYVGTGTVQTAALNLQYNTFLLQY